MTRLPVVAVLLFSLTMTLMVAACAGRETSPLPPAAAEPAAQAGGQSGNRASDHDGNGQPAPDVAECGTIAGLTCPEDEVCEYPAGTCDVADLGGKCVRRPEICTQMWTPVCGCDGKTYSNDCHRLAAGARKDHNGECGARPDS